MDLNLVNSLSEYICTIDNGIISFANNSFETGISSFERVKDLQFVDEFIHAEDCDRFASAVIVAENSQSNDTCNVDNCKTLTFSAGKETPTLKNIDWRITRLKDGSTICSGRPRPSASHEDLENQKERMNLFFQNAPIGVHLLGVDGTIMSANFSALHMLGYSARELIGHNISEFCPDDLKLCREIICCFENKRVIRGVTVRFRTKNGDPKFLLFDTTDTTDTCKHVWCFVRDDTDRRIAKDVLAYELQKLEVAAMKKQQFFKSFLGERQAELSRINEEAKTHLCGCMFPSNREMYHLCLGKDRGQCQLSHENSQAEVYERVILQYLMLSNANAEQLGDIEFSIFFEQNNTISLNPQPCNLLDKLERAKDSMKASFRDGQSLTFRTLVSPNIKARPDLQSVYCDTGLIHALEVLMRTTLAFGPQFGTVNIDVTYIPLEIGEDDEEKGLFRFAFWFPTLFKMDSLCVSRCFKCFDNPENLIAGMGHRHGVTSTPPPALPRPAEEDTPACTWDEPEPTSPPTTNPVMMKRWNLVHSTATNLGLFVSSNTVAIMDGLLQFHSTGKDACFWFEVPLTLEEIAEEFGSWQTGGEMVAKQAEADAGARQWAPIGELHLPMVNQLLQTPPRGNFPTSVGDISDIPSEEPSISNLHVLHRQSRILIVDDSLICQKMMTQALRQLGYATDVADHGRDACDKLSHTPCLFDAVIMDVIMPVMDGYEATKVIRQELRLMSIPIICLSADISPESRTKLFSIGASEFIIKPAKLYELVDLLHNYGLKTSDSIVYLRD